MVLDEIAFGEKEMAERRLETMRSVYEMDILLTWNSRHIANAAIRLRLRKVVEAAGFTLPVICTPEELVETDDEQSD